LNSEYIADLLSYPAVKGGALECFAGNNTIYPLHHCHNAALVDCPGIGRWTAEMFLIFGLKRLDVLSLGDAGLQRAARLLYGVDKEKDGLLASVADLWRPYRSVGCWYLWQSLG